MIVLIALFLINGWNLVIEVIINGWDFVIDLVDYLIKGELNQIVKENVVNVSKEVMEIPILTKEEIYNLIKNVDSEGNIEVDEQIYNKNRPLFEEVQKELDDEFYSYVKNVPIKK